MRTFVIWHPSQSVADRSALPASAGSVFSRSRFGVDPDALSGAADDPLNMPEPSRTELGHSAVVEYAVAWTDENHRRHLGRARVDGDELVLEGTPPGGLRRTLRMSADKITGVGLNRWRPSPAVAVGGPDGEVVVELLLGGWGAAHQLQNAIAAARESVRPADGANRPELNDRVAILAEIRPGKRADLERALAHDHPLGLGGESFEHPEVFLGDTEVIFVFTGPGAASQLREIAQTPEHFRQATRMTEILTAPRLLQ
jgi:hypothetical protein